MEAFWRLRNPILGLRKAVFAGRGHAQAEGCGGPPVAWAPMQRVASLGWCSVTARILCLLIVSVLKMFLLPTLLLLVVLLLRLPNCASWPVSLAGLLGRFGV